MHRTSLLITTSRYIKTPDTAATLDAAMEFAAMHSRFIECGQISAHEGKSPSLALQHPRDPERHRTQDPGYLVFKCISMHGFLVSFLRPKYTEAFRTEFVPKVVSGEIKFTEDARRGLETVGDLFLAIQKGTNTGKAVVLVADE
ncbi:hypothetical protein B0H11DRAFT_2417853 [Mycena galericulata]|nr:hypothetical protein B0H11DRAFT_2417853 [Mycena galericulata]